VQLVSGKGSVCSRCKAARYCSRACQKQHYKDHRRICKALQQQQHTKTK
jgi:radical SAM protein with 4Fe4S-binding SPASM domain